MQASVPVSAPAPAEQKARTVEPLFSAFDDCKQQSFISTICPMPADRPPRFEDMSHLEPQFDPKVHLALGEPEKVTLLDFTEATVTPPAEPNGQSMLAYTCAFRILSDEGVRVVRDILKRNEKYIETCERQPANLRGLAYTSKFIRDFNECPEVMAHLARFAGQPLVPHYMPKNYSHTNIGRMPPVGEVNTLPVDQWHCDSVPFVLIIILSDMTGMVGGELQSIKRKGREAGFKLIEETNNEVPESELLNVNYERQGYGLFMQGSEIVHHVTPVQKALEPRLTVVNSYMPANCFARDRTVYHTFIKEPEALLEFARGRAWRAQNQLAGLVANAKFTDDASAIADHIKRVMSELQMTVDLLEQRVSDRMDYFDEVAAAKKKAPQAQRTQSAM